MNTSAAVAKKTETVSTNYTQLSERELLQAVLLHENRAWNELMRRYGSQVEDRIRAVAWNFSRILDSDAVEDMRQEFWLSVVDNDMDKLRRFKPRGGRRLGSWLCLLAIHSAIDHIRKIMNRSNLEIIETLADDSDEDDTNETDNAVEPYDSGRGGRWLAQFASIDDEGLLD